MFPALGLKASYLAKNKSTASAITSIGARQVIKRTNRMALAAMRTTGLVWSSDVGSVHLFDTVEIDRRAGK